MTEDIEINNKHLTNTPINIDEFESFEEYNEKEEKSSWVGVIPPAGKFEF